MIQNTLYAEYIKEREGAEVFEIPGRGFVTYKIIGSEVVVNDAFVKKDAGEGRCPGVFRALSREISRIGAESGCASVSARVWLSDPNYKTNLKVFLSDSFEIVAAEGGAIYLLKKLRRA